MNVTNEMQYMLFKQAVNFIQERSPKVYIQVIYSMVTCSVDLSDKVNDTLLTINISPVVIDSMAMDKDFCTLVTNLDGKGAITLKFNTKAIAAVYSPDLKMNPVIFHFINSDEKPYFGTEDVPVKASVELVRTSPMDIPPRRSNVYTFDPEKGRKK